MPPSLNIRSILALFVPSNTRLLYIGSRQANKFFLKELRQPLNQNKERVRLKTDEVRHILVINKENAARVMGM